MIVLGITGPTGAGKTTASLLLEGQGIKVIDTDILARKIVEPGKPALLEICEHFGKQIVDDEGKLKRAELAKVVFSNPDELLVLNKITHKYIAQEVEEEIKNYSGDIIGIDGAVLLESGISERCDKIMSIIADDDVRKMRIMERDRLTDEQATERMSAQKNNAFYIENSEYVVYNNDRKGLMSGLEEVIKSLRSMI